MMSTNPNETEIINPIMKITISNIFFFFFSSVKKNNLIPS